MPAGEIRSRSWDSHGRARLQAVEQLRRAVERDQLTADYQPKLRLADGAVAGVEALARWHHPTRGLLSPQEFLPLAEQTGLMHQLTAVMLDRAAAQAAALCRAGLATPVAVNLPASYLLDSQAAARLASAARRHDLPAHLLGVEITETALIGDRPAPKTA